MSEFQGRIFNAEPSPPDANDYELELDTAAPLPVRYVVPGSLPLYSQKAGTCSWHGAAAVRVWQERRDGHGIIQVDIYRGYDLTKSIVDKQPDPLRVIGTHIRSVLRFLKGTGTPLKGVAAPGAGGKITTYWRIATGADGFIDEDAMKRALIRYGPLLVRCDWDEGWMKLAIHRILGSPIGRIVGGHIFVIYGWDDLRNAGSWLMHNSWGRWSFLGTGNAYMAFRYFRFKRPEAWALTDLIGD